MENSCRPDLGLDLWSFARKAVYETSDVLDIGASRVRKDRKACENHLEHRVGCRPRVSFVERPSESASESPEMHLRRRFAIDAKQATLLKLGWRRTPSVDWSATASSAQSWRNRRCRTASDFVQYTFAAARAQRILKEGNL